MDSLYAEYLKERQGIETFFEPDAFVSYRISGLECFLVDMCVAKESRGRGRLRELIDKLEKIAIAEKCECISANIHLTLPGADSALRGALAVGFEVLRAQNDVLLISKEIVED